MDPDQETVVPEYRKTKTAGVYVRHQARCPAAGGDGRDFEDIVTLLDRRPELIAELRSADAELRGVVAGEMQRLLGKAGFPDGVAAALPPDAASQGRAIEVVRPAFEVLADLTADV